MMEQAKVKLENIEMPPSILRKRPLDKGDAAGQQKAERRVRFREPEAIYFHASRHCPSSGLSFLLICACILLIMTAVLYCHHVQLGLSAFKSRFVIFALRLKHNAAICWNLLRKQQ
ncbi:nutritionally-regulated adipose and cardiac enriched protein homolog [Hyperolius riggenbachi]|uniref:nutritionally-regulated adipose and cardiac enriched protein homolog n=1 Tax=Hyperolius riggenbachi TaxID=752182 RepID=UPI0035A2C687